MSKMPIDAVKNGAQEVRVGHYRETGTRVTFDVVLRQEMKNGLGSRLMMTTSGEVKGEVDKVEVDRSHNLGTRMTFDVVLRHDMKNGLGSRLMMTTSGEVKGEVDEVEVDRNHLGTRLTLDVVRHHVADEVDHFHFLLPF